MRSPVLGNINTPTYPHLPVIGHVLKKAHQTWTTTGMSGDALMQAHRHHFGSPLTFGIE